MLVNSCKTLKLASVGKHGLVMVKLWDVKTLKHLCDGCNRARCVGCFNLYLATIFGNTVALPVYVCMLEYLLQTSEVLRIFPEAPTPGGSGNFLEGSELC
jgi:hypothetical protein